MKESRSEEEIEFGTRQTSVLADRPSRGAVATRPSRRSTSSRSESVREELDRISLVQALSDAETANARVIDLTQRLVEAGEQVAALRAELERMRLDYVQLQATHEQMRSSSAYRLAERIWTIRNALGL